MKARRQEETRAVRSREGSRDRIRCGLASVESACVVLLGDGLRGEMSTVLGPALTRRALR